MLPFHIPTIPDDLDLLTKEQLIQLLLTCREEFENISDFFSNQEEEARFRHSNEWQEGYSNSYDINEGSDGDG
jgi:hypothetical protein